MTEDHSLLLENKEIAKPTQVGVGTALLHGNCVESIDTCTDTSITKEEAKVMGFFFGDGSCGTYQCRSGVFRICAMKNSKLEYLDYNFLECPFELN